MKYGGLQPALFLAFGKRQTLRQWAEEYGIKLNTLESRVGTRNWPLEKALTTPLKARGARPVVIKKHR